MGDAGKVVLKTQFHFQLEKTPEHVSEENNLAIQISFADIYFRSLAWMQLLVCGLLTILVFEVIRFRLD